MFEYIKGIVFIFFLIVFLQLLGKRIHDSDYFCENFLYGFVFYTCLQFLGGGISQLFRLPWMFYKCYMILMLIILILFVFYKNPIKFEIKCLVLHFKNHWIIYVLALLFVVLSLMNLQYQWNGNNIDDGYYLNKIAMSPYVNNYVDYNFATGFDFKEGLSRIINTFELEAAFFSNILGISASVYCKVFLSYFHYFLILNGFFWLFNIVSENTEKKHQLTWAMIPILFFGIYQETLVNNNMLFLPDSWQFNTAIWYGSSLVRCIGFVLLMVPIIKYNGLCKKNIFFFFASCIALFSKASQMLPVIYLILLSYVIMFLLIKIKKCKKTWLLIMFIIFTLLIMPIPQEIMLRYQVINDLFIKNIKTLPILISIVVYFGSFVLNNEYIKKINFWILIIAILMFCPKLNTLFLWISMYDFVAARTMTLFFFTLMVLTMLYGYLLLMQLLKSTKFNIIVYSSIGILSIFVPLVSIQNSIGIKYTLVVLKHNSDLVPQSTLDLGNALMQIEKEKNIQLNVLTPAWITMNRTSYALASMLRYNAMDLKVISAIPRYNSTNDKLYQTYTQEVQDIFEYYINGTEMNEVEFSQLVKKFKINCIIVTSESIAEHLEKEQGFKLYNKVDFILDEGSYYILIN